MDTQKLWVLKSKGSKSAFSGNDGYADELDAFYLYDTTVKNHDKIKQGDYVLLVDKYHIKGSASIERIDSQDNIKKKRYRCPECNTQEHSSRKTISPKYRCRNKHEFDVPDEEDIIVTQFKAHYASTFISYPPKVSVKNLEGYYIKRNKYYSIQQAELSFITGITKDLVLEKKDIAIVSISLPKIPYQPSITDSRSYKIVKSSIRPTQDRFRSNLMKIYGTRCMLTGCEVSAALEASHICPYKGEQDNHMENGILLRRDIHALYDADLIGIEPNQLRVTISNTLKGSSYQKYDGSYLLIPESKLRPSVKALSVRWNVFEETNVK